MTRQEFIEEVATIDEFQQWCYDNDEDDRIEGWFHEDDFGETIDNDVRECISQDSWEYLRDCLNNVNQTSESGWFRYNGWFDYEPIDEYELEALKQSVLDSDFEFDEEEEDDDEDGDEEHTAPVSNPAPRINDLIINWNDWDVAIKPEPPSPVVQENPEEKHAMNVLLFGGEE